MLNRRFVTTYFNSFSGIGVDPTAREFLENAGFTGQLKYGAIFTPQGEFIVSFGFDCDEFFRALAFALKEHPEYDTFSEQENALIERAESQEDDVIAPLELAQMYVELLEFDQAINALDRALDRNDTSPDDRARLEYMKGHVVSLDLGNPQPGRVREIYASIENPPSDIQDDIAIDLLMLDTRQRADGAFFKGWEFNQSRDPATTIAELESWIDRAPESNRIGQMHFLLGVAHIANNDLASADDVWQTHLKRYPDDRFAMLSRLHESSYVFSPNNPRIRIGGGTVITDPRGGGSKRPRRSGDAVVIGGGGSGGVGMMKLMQRIQQSGGRIEMRNGDFYINGEKVSDEEAAILRKMFNRAGGGSGESGESGESGGGEDG